MNLEADGGYAARVKDEIIDDSLINENEFGIQSCQQDQDTPALIEDISSIVKLEDPYRTDGDEGFDKLEDVKSNSCDEVIIKPICNAYKEFTCLEDNDSFDNDTTSTGKDSWEHHQQPSLSTDVVATPKNVNSPTCLLCGKIFKTPSN